MKGLREEGVGGHASEKTGTIHPTVLEGITKCTVLGEGLAALPRSIEDVDEDAHRSGAFNEAGKLPLPILEEIVGVDQDQAQGLNGGRTGQPIPTRCRHGFKSWQTPISIETIRVRVKDLNGAI
jgi:hypothetical protein